MNLFVVDPHWGGWIIAYFFLGGIAAGGFFAATLVELAGSADDREAVKPAYWVAFPLIALCNLFLVVDLNRPERFWHMLLKSEVTKAAFAEGFPLSLDGWRLALHAPIFKYFSPMSSGSWGLSAFTACAAVMFFVTLWPTRRLVRWANRPWLLGPVKVVGSLSAFYVASYTGSLLAATNQPVWSDTTWIAPLFLASAVSTGLATLALLARWKQVGTPGARHRVESADLPAIGLEGVLFLVFVASLGPFLVAVLGTVTGWVMLLGTTLVGLLAPAVIHWRAKAPAAAAACVLVGGFCLRLGVVALPAELLHRAPLGTFSPEDRRHVGERGGDPGNRDPRVSTPRGKLGSAPVPP